MAEADISPRKWGVSSCAGTKTGDPFTPHFTSKELVPHSSFSQDVGIVQVRLGRTRFPQQVLTKAEVVWRLGHNNKSACSLLRGRQAHSWKAPLHFHIEQSHQDPNQRKRSLFAWKRQIFEAVGHKEKTDAWRRPFELECRGFALYLPR